MMPTHHGFVPYIHLRGILDISIHFILTKNNYYNISNLVSYHSKSSSIKIAFSFSF
jgi:hypothetical protein